MSKLNFRVYAGGVMVYFDMWDIVRVVKHFSSVPDESDYIQVKNGLSFSRRCNVMQYTGLKDKNSKWIYDGDILESPYLIRELVKVYWDETDLQWRVEILNAKGEHSSLSKWVEENELHCEIIGNQYENPELLKVEV